MIVIFFVYSIVVLEASPQEGHVHHEEGLAGVDDRMHGFQEVLWAEGLASADPGYQNLEFVDIADSPDSIFFKCF